MSRSYTKSTFTRNGQTHSRASEKKDKQTWHQKYRRMSKQICDAEKDNEDFTTTNLPVKDEVSEVYSFAKDGKRYIKPEIMRELRDESDHRITKDLKFRK